MVPAPVEASVVPPPTADAAASATPSAPQAVSPSPPAASPTPVEATRTALVGPPNEPERSPARAAGALPPPTRPAAAAPQPAAGAPTSVSPGVTTAATPSRATVAARPPAPAPRARTETPAARAEAAAGRADPARGRTASSRDRSATRDRTTDAASSTTRERAAAVTREPARPAAPERYWVQVASGANKANLGRAWEGIVAKAPALLRGRPTWTTPWRASNRLLVGPFPSEEAAQAFVNRLGGAGVSGIQFTSRAGVAVERLATR